MKLILKIWRNNYENKINKLNKFKFTGKFRKI